MTWEIVLPGHRYPDGTRSSQPRILEVPLSGGDGMTAQRIADNATCRLCRRKWPKQRMTAGELGGRACLFCPQCTAAASKGDRPLAEVLAESAAKGRVKR